MDQRDLSRHVLVEHQTLGHVIAALRATIGWNYQKADFSRKLQSLRFVGKSFQRHLKHLMRLEEEGGYLSVVVASRPELKDTVDALGREHAEFRKGLVDILTRLRHLAPTDHATFAATTADLVALLDRLDEHGKKETDLLQEALLTDEGGEG
jgi:hypothetical protein